MPSEEMNPLDALNLETERVLFKFYGWKKRDGTNGGPYFKLAHSFAEAFSDLMLNDAVLTAPYVVNDIFVELPDEGETQPTLHIQLRDLSALPSIDELLDEWNA